MTEPRPYSPPDSRPPVPVPGKQSRAHRKPWMLPRPGETKEQFDHRVAHSCYRCGVYIVSMTALALHEDECEA